MRMKTLDHVDVAGKRVLVRVDLNLPVLNGRVSDATRMVRILPTINEIADRGGKVVLLSHFGRPKGRDQSQSLRPIATAMAGALGRSVSFHDDCIGDGATAAVASLANGDVLVLENTRFHAGEEANTADFAQALAINGDLFVNDAFSAAHRAHASTEGLARRLPAFAGRALEAEVAALTIALDRPKRPVIAIVGGSKVSTKLPVLSNLIKKVETLFVCGAMANTFLLAHGLAVGRSLVEPDLVETARSILADAEAHKCRLVVPFDAVCAAALKPGQATRTTYVSRIQNDDMILDAGPMTVELVGDLIANSKTVLWNGPLGAFEVQPFDKATSDLARIVARATKGGHITSVAGGGDTVAALNCAGVANDFSYVSTAGGAFLEWMEGKTLPGVAALMH